MVKSMESTQGDVSCDCPPNCIEHHARRLSVGPTTVLVNQGAAIYDHLPNWATSLIAVPGSLPIGWPKQKGPWPKVVDVLAV